MSSDVGALLSAIVPTLVLGALFYGVMRAIINADANERRAAQKLLDQDAKRSTDASG